jgi:hypothetical protein
MCSTTATGDISSTPEAEIVAADYAMRQEGMPAFSLMACILERPVRLRMMEDNEAMIPVCHLGKNPTMRYLNRTRKAGVAWLMVIFENPVIDIYKIDTELQVADIGTKRIACLDAWRSNCIVINLSEPNVSAAKQRELLSNLRADTVAKLGAREEQQWMKALERAGTCRDVRGPCQRTRGGF